SMDLSGALELGADAAQRVAEVLIERGGIQLRQLFHRRRCRLSALVTVGHDLMDPVKRGRTAARICSGVSGSLLLPTRPPRVVGMGVPSRATRAASSSTARPQPWARTRRGSASQEPSGPTSVSTGVLHTRRAVSTPTHTMLRSLGTLGMFIPHPRYR